MVETISTEDVQELLDDGDAPLVYVMSKKQYERGHIPESISIPESELSTELPERFDEDEPIALYCASESCQASERAARKVQSIGYENVLEYEGGFATWEDAGLPVEEDASSQKH